MNRLYRNIGYEYLKGNGLEIGALHQPASVPEHCNVEYCDANSKEEMKQMFPELNIEQMVDVDHICNLDKQGLTIFPDNSYDFVILNHVIEHVANPIKVIEEMNRITKDNGCIVISAPDKRFTFDIHRRITEPVHLLVEYERNVTEVSDLHYIDFLLGVDPNRLFRLNEEGQKELIEHVKNRREHAHVWDSNAFREFLHKCAEFLNINGECLYESTGDENNFEYFSVWKIFK